MKFGLAAYLRDSTYCKFPIQLKEILR